jgi:hypothetical protein
MKKLFPLICSVLLFYSCSSDQKQQPETIPPVKYDTLLIGKKVYNVETPKDTNYTFTEIDRYQENDSAALLNNVGAHRRGDSLFLKCDNGETALVNNLKEDGDYVAYRYLLFDPNINHHVIHCSFYEGSGVLIIDKKTGKKTEVLGIPAVAPDKKHFACGNCDLIARYDVSGIELYELKNSTYESMGLREIMNWGPQQMTWKNDTSLVVRGLEQKSDTSEPVRMFKILYIK